MKNKTMAAALALAVLLAAPVSAGGILEKLFPRETEELSEKIPPERGLEITKEWEKSAPASAGESFSWYCMRSDDGSRPPIPPEMSFVTDCGGVFLGEDEKVIYLTFDAGYENGNVEKILDVLKAEEVPAAFFILENLVTRNTDLVKRMAEEGHTVCNHTARHGDMSLANREEFSAELESMEKIYRDTIGCEIGKYYRPPEGKFSRDNLMWAQEMGYTTVFWSCAYADWDNGRQMEPDAAKEKLLKNTHNGEVLLLHPTSSTNAAILSDLIREWKSMGYRFGTLGELCGK
ncbi:MAG: polysaccharide deacetylase family protein [Clostridia bacterium]|nr:polysaccharide deacetylase family protein [Clostridia bacterium]